MSGENKAIDLDDERYADIKDRASILAGINAGRKVVLVTYSLSEIMERQLDFVIAAILKFYERPALQSTLYTCLKEIVVNATRANAKKKFFDSQNLRIDDPEEYKRGNALMKEQMSEQWIEKYGGMAREADLRVTIAIEHEPAGLRAWVINDALLLSAEEARIRERFADGMSYEDLVSFYMSNADQTEGAGMGLVMNLLLLKGENINPALFRIGMVDGKTTARIEVPFTSEFKSVRGDDPGGFKERPDDIRLDYRRV